jgi:hypothetical protein
VKGKEMLHFLRRVRPRHTFSTEDREIWQSILRQMACNDGWLVSYHARESIRRGRADESDIERLKDLNQWYVWALELGTEDVVLEAPKPKLLVRYPSPETNGWKIGGVVAIGKPLVIVTIFGNSNWIT